MGKKRLRDIALLKRETYWGGSTWVYHSHITNTGIGTISWEISPGEDNEFEVYYGMVLNGDSAARNTFAVVQDGPTPGYDIATFLPYGLALAAGTRAMFPTTDENAASGDYAVAPTRLMISGTMILRIQVTSVASGQDAALGVVGRVRGKKPTVLAVSLATSFVEDQQRDALF